MGATVDIKSGVYVERDCVIHHEELSFEAGGAYVSPEYLIAYLGNNRVLNDWHGQYLGTYRITSSWPIQSMNCATMSQVEATVAGVTYTGRSRGVGMVFRGRPKKGGH